MAHVDYLSREPTGQPTDTLDEVVSARVEVCLTLNLEDQIVVIQRSDPDLAQLAQVLEKPAKERTREERGVVKDVRLKNGKLFHVEEDGRLLFMMPKSMRKTLCVKFHDMQGHFSTDRTVAKIKELYWFPGMKRYVRQHVQRCFECLIAKVPGGKKPGLLNPIPPGKRPFQIVHVDHLGPFVRSARRNQWILVFVDNMTKFVKLYPV